MKLTKASEKLRSELHSELRKLNRRRSEIKLELANLEGGKPAPKRKPRLKLWLLVMDYLTAHGSSDLLTIGEALTDQGHDLGRYPKRTISQCVAAQDVKGLFTVSPGTDRENSVIGLRKRDPKSEPKYVPIRAARAGR